jgi:hypothetical protein
MKTFVLLIALLAFAPLAQADGGFLSGQADLPLMPGLTEDADNAMVFDSQEGRLAQFTARGKVAADKIKQFYADTLPQLGWEAQGSGRFVREKEQLRLIVKQTPKGDSEARFELAPLKSR